MRTNTKLAAVICTAALTGCADITLSAVHESLPMIANDRFSYEGVEIGARWENKKAFIETNTTYVIHDYGLLESPWIGTVRVGIKLFGVP